MIHQLHRILCGLKSLPWHNHWRYAAARRMQESAAVGW
ncbi:nucleocapsid protein [Escherichia coli]|nr:nucleocapsid protein [Escherichia coli]EEW3193636.1 nucleocapsid protein [Escherichia coli]EEY3527251.1 nucleocapsid protein [Escherichia coli]EEY4017668.1 nucleocapsid protein [Escherichia coli]EFN7307424.1 nucleocapsid protein [Escherichia coli]